MINVPNKFKTCFFTLSLVMTGMAGFLLPATAQAQVQDPSMVKLINPIGGTKEKPEGTVDLQLIVGGVLAKALGIMGSAALFMFVVGGALWLTSAGNAERVEKGTETMIWSAIGVLIIFSSYAILRLVLGGLGAQGLDGSSSNGAADTAQTPAKGACICATLDVAANTVKSSKMVSAASSGECEVYPEAKGGVDVCSWTELKPGAGCLCKKIDVESKAILGEQVIDAIDNANGCSEYEKTNGDFNACGWYSIK